MTVCDDCFREFLHPLVHDLMNKNARFEEMYGHHARWDWDDVSATLTFSDPVLPPVRIDVAVVGTTEGDSWEWSWANPNYGSHSKMDMEKVREFGDEKGFEMLTSPFVEADEYTGWEMTAIAAHVLDAPGAYRFSTEVGFCYLVYLRIHESKIEANQ